MVKTVEFRLSMKQKKLIGITDLEIFVEGSAGAGKTLYAAHKTILYALTHKKARLGVYRDTLPALKSTAWLEIRELLDGYELPYKENKNDKTIKFPNGSTIYFKSLDDPKKVRSANLDFIWVEQAEEISYASFQELKRRLRGKVGMNDYLQIIFTLTPETPDHWIYEYTRHNNKGRIIHFHYKENPFLPGSYIKELEELKELDYELWVKYAEGLWGKLSNIIYNNWDGKELQQTPEYYVAGADFGYNDPSVFLLIGYYDHELYIIDEVYKRHLTNTEFITKCKEMLRDHNLNPSSLDKCYGDAAEPDRIEEFSQEGFDMIGGSKKVLRRIDLTKSVKIHISSECVETKKEIKSYKWQKDKNENILDKPVKFNDHAMNALEHAAAGILEVPEEEEGETLGIIA